MFDMNKSELSFKCLVVKKKIELIDLYKKNLRLKIAVKTEF